MANRFPPLCLGALQVAHVGVYRRKVLMCLEAGESMVDAAEMLTLAVGQYIAIGLRWALWSIDPARHEGEDLRGIEFPRPAGKEPFPRGASGQRVVSTA